MRNAICAPVVFLSLLPISALADVSGVWPIQGPIDPVCTLRQQGNALSGECRGPAAQGPVTGTVDGPSVRFTFTRTGRAGQAMPPVSFTATQNGDTLTGTVAMDNRPPGAFAARRDTAKPLAPPATVPGQAAAALNQTPPRTVFDVADDGMVLHQQSQLACPQAVQNFARIGTTLFDLVGFDVACSYRNAAGSAITLYVYGANGRGTMDQDFEGARQSISTNMPGIVPADAAQRITPSGAGWRSAAYVLPKGDRTELHIAPLSDWRVKFRISYAPRDQETVRLAVAELSAQVEKSAGAHLAACTASPKPVRDGKPYVEPGTLRTVAAAAAATALLGIQQTPVRTWCVEGSFLVGQAPFLYWQNIVPTSLGGAVDRITALNPIAPVLVLEVSREALNRTAQSLTAPVPQGEGEVYSVVVDTPDAMQVVGFFLGRPTPEAVMTVVLRQNLAAYASVSKKPGGGITLFQPQ